MRGYSNSSAGQTLRGTTCAIKPKSYSNRAAAGAEISHAYAEILQQMTHLSSFAELRTDPLTGVSNRRPFDDSLAALLERHARHGESLSVAMLDIDFFKRVNDEQGHLQGDRVLQGLAQLLKSELRETDVLAHYGGEEFVILMPATPLAAACHAAERYRANVEQNLSVTISIGLAGAMPEDNASSLLSRADAALYLAKGSGRNCVYLYENSLGQAVAVTERLAAAQPDETHSDVNGQASAAPIDDRPTILSLAAELPPPSLAVVQRDAAP